MPEKLIEMELREIQMIEDFSRSQIIVLAEKEGERAFPIFIGLHEAMAMDLAARQEKTPRPLTHDLIMNVIDGLGAKLVRAMVVKLEHDTFLGAIELETAAGGLVRIDSRPSDAIVLATKRRAPIFVEEQVLVDVQRGADAAGADEEESGPV
jgi:uncharacterized protein